MIKSSNLVRIKLRAGWVLAHCGAWWLLPPKNGEMDRTIHRRRVYFKTAQAVTEDTQFARLDTNESKQAGTWGVWPDRFKVTTTAKLSGGYVFRHTSPPLHGPESRARKQARQGVLKVFPDAQVRIVNVFHDRKAEQRAAQEMAV